MNPQTPAEITTNIIAFIRAEGGLLSPLAEQLLRPALEQALEDAERRGKRGAGEMRTTGARRRGSFAESTH